MQAHLNKNCPRAPDNAKSQPRQPNTTQAQSFQDSIPLFVEGSPPNINEINRPIKLIRISKIDEIDDREQKILEFFFLDKATFSPSFVDNSDIIRFF